MAAVEEQEKRFAVGAAESLSAVVQAAAAAADTAAYSAEDSL